MAESLLTPRQHFRGGNVPLMSPAISLFLRSSAGVVRQGPEHLPSFIGLEAFRKNRARRFDARQDSFTVTRQSLGRHNRRLGQR